MDYEEMLERAMELKPKEIESGERFEIPEADILVIGGKTIIRNFGEICKTIDREPQHFAKFLSRELAAPASIQDHRLEINSRILIPTVRRKMEAYYKEYVFCHQCGKPDTKIIKEGKFQFLKCMACGSRKIVKALK